MPLIVYSILPLHNSSIIVADLVHDKTRKSPGLKPIFIYHYFSNKYVTRSDMAVNRALGKPTHGGVSRSIANRKGKSIFRLCYSKEDISFLPSKWKRSNVINMPFGD